MSKKYNLFSVFGIEAEYMIVDKKTLKVKPIADEILKRLNNGKYTNEVECGQISWSNELVNHVLEIKCTSPESSLNKLDEIFHQGIQEINSILNEYQCVLMPTAIHPWFDPAKETMLWPHGQRDIYKLYDEIFDCKGHGWSNLQSVHINLPYNGEDEFRKLHSAIRAVLPLIPYLAASSPFVEGKLGELADNRLGFYEKNQERIPSIIGNIIPEVYTSTKEYHQMLEGIYKDIAIYDHAKTLQNPWLNSRAAIPKFDVGAIEIRLMDIQEAPYMDFCLIHFIVELVKWVSTQPNLSLKSEKLSDAYLRTIYDEMKKFEPSPDLKNYIEFFGMTSNMSLNEFLLELFRMIEPNIPTDYHKGIDLILTKGSLSQRLSRAGLSPEVYQQLIVCLKENIPYV